MIPKILVKTFEKISLVGKRLYDNTASLAYLHTLIYSSPLGALPSYITIKIGKNGIDTKK